MGLVGVRPHHPCRPGVRGAATYALVVDDLDNGGQAAVLELENATNLNATPRAGSDLNFCHFIVCWGVAVESAMRCTEL